MLKVKRSRIFVYLILPDLVKLNDFRKYLSRGKKLVNNVLFFSFFNKFFENKNQIIKFDTTPLSLTWNVSFRVVFKRQCHKNRCFLSGMMGGKNGPFLFVNKVWLNAPEKDCNPILISSSGHAKMAMPDSQPYP